MVKDSPIRPLGVVGGDCRWPSSRTPGTRGWGVTGLPLVQAPTLVLHRRDYPLLPLEHARYLASHLRDGRLVELPGTEVSLAWETPELALDHIEAFLSGARRAGPLKGVDGTWELFAVAR
jgi:pimeloyl-ACP methyl ester carboxylesterase